MSIEQERRRHERYPFERDLELRAPAGTFRVLAHNISEIGFSFSSATSLAVGEQIQLALGEDADFLVHAEVRNVRRERNRWIVGAERVRSLDD